MIGAAENLARVDEAAAVGWALRYALTASPSGLRGGCAPSPAKKQGMR
jgi:hypothetical protein